MHPQRPGLGNFRLRIRNLPPDYAKWAARGSAGTLRRLIANTLGIHTSEVDTDRKWTSRDGKKAWAFLAVNSHEEGTELIERIGEIGGMKVQAQWRHEK